MNRRAVLAGTTALLALGILGSSGPAPSGAPGADDPLFTTFSIAARDRATGDLGVAVSTRAAAVGSVVPWARAGVGAVATQAWTNAAFGPQGLDLLAAGIAPKEALARLLAEDASPERRQIGIVNADGVVSSHTGKETLAWSGAIEGDGFTVQGNLLTGRETLEAMAASFRGSEAKGLSLPERLLAALEAGQAAGGDRRGRQSAALLVASLDPERRNDRAGNLRVDDHPDPVRELRRLFETVRGRLGHRELYQASGRDVRELQEMLRRAGLLDREPTGLFDDPTAGAVQAFRRARGLYAAEAGGPVGLVDAAFLEALRAHLASLPATGAPASGTGGPPTP